MDSDDDTGVEDATSTLIYGGEPRVLPPWMRYLNEGLNEDSDTNGDKPEPTIKPKMATEEDLKKGLHVKKLDLKIAWNTGAHLTNDYECTEEHTVDEKVQAPELVVRRGQSITLGIEFDRPYEKAKHDVKFRLTTGKLATINKETHGQFDLDESGEKENKPGEWSGKLVTREGNSITVAIYIPADCAIGEWNIGIFTMETDGAGKNTKRLYNHSDHFYILFNPWCKDDQVYMKDSSLLKEYVLNSHTAIYTAYGLPWNLGQFEAGMLDAALNIIRKCFKPTNMYQLADPIKVSRVIAQVVNCCDSDNGVLWGNWSGKYDDGVSPNTWSGSVKILQQYMKTGQPVKYGQCWVFSGVTTTVCRAIGLPARSVTNYSSAHDTDESNTIDIYYHEEDKKLVRDDNSDSVWNFHVWNEVWMMRPDLDDKQCNYNGWQVIDATPQECSGGVFTCGPCSVEAVKHGLVSKPYDGSFVFSEVNADKVHWKPTDDGDYERFKLEKDSVGKRISTKKPDGLPYAPKDWFEKHSLRYILTDTYKFPEESVENREAVMRAACSACKPLKASKAYTDSKHFEDIKFKLLHADNLNYGQDVDVTLKATTDSDYTREISVVSFRFASMKYTGRVCKAFKVDNRDLHVTPKKGEGHEFKTTLKFDEYSKHLDENLNMCIQAYALVKATFGRPVQNCVKHHNVTFAVPNLDVKLPPTANKGEAMEAVVRFKNPLKTTLTECTVDYESGGVDNKDDIKQPDVPALGTYEGKFKLIPKRGGRFTLTFRFSSRLLKNLTGCASVLVNKEEEKEEEKVEEKEKEKVEKEKEKDEEMEVA